MGIKAKARIEDPTQSYNMNALKRQRESEKTQEYSKGFP
jgi:hypothetical protein